MNTTIVKISGMHCKSCEVLIREKLEEIKDVKKADVSLKNRSATVYSKYPPDMEKIESAVREAGYQIGEDFDRRLVSRNIADYKDLGLAIAALALLYAAGSWLGLFNLNFAGVGSSEGLGVIFLVGITAGLSTCMALVGGLVLGVAARHAEKHPEAGAMMKFRPHLFFNLGRVVIFFMFGGIIGSLGGIFRLSGTSLGVLMILVGVVMLVLGLNLTGIFPRLSGLSVALPGTIAKFFGITKKQEKEYSHLNSFLLGGATFFLPCGFTQAMQLYAVSTGNFLAGALTMGVFALGTAPGLLGVGGLASVVKGSFARIFYKFAGVLVILFALINVAGGYNLTGWTFGRGSAGFDAKNGGKITESGGLLPDDEKVGQTNVTIENGIQVARMEQNANGFFPNSFTVKSGMPVKWIIYATDRYSCSSSLVASKLGVSQNLKMGENVIEFTPDSSGVIKFSCGMGMYPGEFTVI